MEEDIVFTVKEHEYSAGKLDAKRQFHILRRLLPFMGGVVQDGLLNSNDNAAVGAFLDMAGTIPDGQLDYVIDHCLSVVKRKDGDIWAAISAPLPNGGRELQYKDIDMTVMLIIVFNVLKRNLSGFFDALPSDLAEKFKGAMSAT